MHQMAQDVMRSIEQKEAAIGSLSIGNFDFEDDSVSG